MDAQLNAELENAQQCLLETIELANMYGDDSHKDSAQYLKMMETLCEIRSSSERNGKALEAAKEERTIEEFDRVLELEKSKIFSKKFEPKKTSTYKAFQKALDQVVTKYDGSSIPQPTAAASSSKNMDQMELVIESEINVIDPLTKRRMQNPVRNSLCGHHYEKESVIQAIGINKRLRCPVAGCGNKNFVQVAHLIDDADFRRRLAEVNEMENEDPLC